MRVCMCVCVRARLCVREMKRNETAEVESSLERRAGSNRPLPEVLRGSTPSRRRMKSATPLLSVGAIWQCGALKMRQGAPHLTLTSTRNVEVTGDWCRGQLGYRGASTNDMATSAR